MLISATIDNIYYDTYAHVKYGGNYDFYDNFHGLKTRVKMIYELGESPVRVNSCFSGFTIYKTQSLIKGDDIYYDMSDYTNLECEHVRLHKKLDYIYMNPSMIHLLILNPS